MKLPVNRINNFTEVNFKKGKITCPVCGNTHNYHCSVTEDEGLALCKYVISDKQAKDGRFEHILKSNNENIHSVTPQINKIETKVVEKSDADKLNAVYSALLKSLKLEETHSNQLLENRGLSDTTIARNLYASVPERKDNFKIGMTLSKQFNLEGVPGFYVQDGCWGLNINYSGFYIPYRDVQGQIVGLQIRKDKDEDQKYIWLSSKDKEKGCSSGSPLHFVNPQTVNETTEVFITEGALKADVIGELYSVGVVAIAGVNAMSAENLTNILFEKFPYLSRIILAFDMDWQTKNEVRDSLLKMITALSKKSITVMIATWDVNLGKGLDDVLFKAHSEDLGDEVLINYVRADEFSEQLVNNKSLSETEISLANKYEELEQLVENPAVDDKTEKEFTILSSNNQNIKNETSLGSTWRELSQAKIEKPERVIAGLCRGNVGQLVASTNIGKTTLILNLAISVSADKAFEPLFNEQTVGKRIMYIDGEATKAELQADLLKMLESCSVNERNLVKENLYVICDEEINDEPLDLVVAEHCEKILEAALLFKPDLIIFDTLSALANMEDENDNAKVKKEVIQPLKTLAKKTNSAILMLHHTGKYNEGSPQAQDAYKGRGASALGALCRTVFNLKESKDKVFLSCSKVKGEKFPKTVLKLDQDSRWFKVVDDSESDYSKPSSNYEQVIKFVKDAGKPVKRDEIKKGLGLTDPTLTRILEEAVENGDLTKPKYSYYSVPENVNLEQELPLE